LSKLSQLKKEAYQAGKKRNWEAAVALYEQILAQDKNNPTVINELGDLCLKSHQTPQALRHFLSAAAKYRQTGLLNNAVAIYKKILRYEGANVNAHWYLAETRASQGLLVEGENHGLHFLEHSRNVTADLKEIFLKRCLQLFELYPESQPILERLVQIFRTWDLNLEAARAGCLLACGQWDAGEKDEACKVLKALQERCPELANYPEWAQWQQRMNPDGAPAGTYSDFGTVDLATTDEQTKEPAPTAVDADKTDNTSPATDGLDRIATPAVDPAPPAGDELHTAGGTAAVATDESAATPAAKPAATSGEDGCISIDAAATTSDFDELLGAAVADVERAPEPAATTAAPVDETPTAAAPPDDGPVDLLAEILADDENLLAGGDDNQLASITREIGAQVGGEGAGNDPQGLYDQGTVYLEMGMFDEACAAFSRAASGGDAEVALRAREMWGVTLQRADRIDEAVDVLRAGLEKLVPGTPEHLGMLYKLGRTCAAAGRVDEAAGAFADIVEHDENYLDVQMHLSALSTA